MDTMACEPKTSRRSRLSVVLGKYYVHFIIVVLLSASLYYFVAAQRLRSVTLESNPHLFNSGDLVHISEVVDGDEVVISDKNGRTTLLRLLGIRSFSPTIKDPLLSNYGRICFQFLKSTAINKKAKLSVSEKRLDNKGRLLGTLYLEDSGGEYSEDLGLALVVKGYSLVYTRFDFPEIDKYLESQNNSINENSGFWSDTNIKERALMLLSVWEEEKRND